VKQGILAAPIVEAGAHLQHQYCRSINFFIHCALPISELKIAAPIVLAQHKGHKRIGEGWKAIRRALPTVSEIAN
jgi:hypothetical protein